MEQLIRIKYAIWSDRLAGHYELEEAWDIVELLLVAKNALLKEGLK